MRHAVDADQARTRPPTAAAAPARKGIRHRTTKIVDLWRIPDWAPAFADTVVGDAQAGWRASKDGREFAVRVAVDKDAGTVDYLREVSPGREGGAYLRAVPRPGGGTVIVMTLPLLPDVDPADVAATLTAELSALAELLTRSS